VAEQPPPPDPQPLPSPVFDAHTHLDAMAQRAGREADRPFVEAAMARARAVGVHRVITVADSMASARWCVRAADWHPDVFAAVAVHPTEINGMTEADYDELAELAEHPKVVAIGETGLDYYWDTTDPAAQQEHFRRHIELAKRTGRALMIHDRDAHEDVLRILDEQGAPAKVAFHAFSGDVDFARRCVAAGYVLSFPGVVTFTNAPTLRDAAATVPIDQVTVETDAPFLTPHPYRGRPNAPYLLPLTLIRLAEVMSVGPDILAAAIRQTGTRLYGDGFTFN
jgi:TatD DNase family protein